MKDKLKREKDLLSILKALKSKTTYSILTNLKYYSAV